MGLFKSLAEAAKRVRGFLSLFAFLILALVAVFVWAFSQGALDPLIANFSILDKHQFFTLVMTVLLMVFTLVILGVILSFIRTGPAHKGTAFGTIHVVVHEAGDRTFGISDAEVILTLPEPVRKQTTASGTASLFFPSAIASEQCHLNARKLGYKPRRAKRVILKDGVQIFIGLKRMDVQPEEEDFDTFVNSNREAVERFLIAERTQLNAGYVAGTTRVEVREVVEEDGLFIPPPWADYKEIPQDSALIDHLMETVKSGSHILLLGEPGQGKTTVLKRIYSKLTDRFLGGYDSRIPVFIALREIAFTDEKFTGSMDWLWNFLSSRHSIAFPFPKNAFVAGLRDGSVVLLLDGFDEISERLTQRVVNEYSSAEILFLTGILSCRVNFYDLHLTASPINSRFETKLRLLPFVLNKAVRSYIAAFFDEEGSISYSEVMRTIETNPRLRDLARRPLLLNMILDVFSGEMPVAGEGNVEWNMAKLYQLYTTKWLNNEATKPDSLLRGNQKDDLMEIIAWSAYKGLVETTAFTWNQVASWIAPVASRFPGNSLPHLVEDVCTRSFIIGRYGGYHYFIHKSFQEYYVARTIFRSLLSDEKSAGEALNEHILVEVAAFLKDMLTSDFPPVQRARATAILMTTCDRFSGHDMRSLCVRESAAYFLARIGTSKGIRFLEQAREKEANKWVQRGLTMGLVLFCGQSDKLEEYLATLRTDGEARSINVGYHLCYYGDQPLEEGYFDLGRPRCEGTVRAIFRHLRSEKYRDGWPLDFFTLRSLISHPARGPGIIDTDPSYRPFLESFVSQESDQDSDLLCTEKRIMREYLERTRNG